MLGRKLILIAAAVALALTSVANAKTHHTNGKVAVRRHHEPLVKVTFKDAEPDKNLTAKGDGDADADDDDDDDGEDVVEEVVIELCLPGWTEVSVEGVEGVYCAKGQICVADVGDGTCPEPQQGLPYGAYCDKVKTGVYGCKPKTKDMVEESGETPKCNGEGESPMSVEGVEGVFCVKGQACVADIKDGACPGPQEGLPNGAVCGKVKTGVYGCKPAEGKGQPDDSDDDDDDDDDDEEADAHVCGEGESPMSVEGVEGIFCVKGQACVADIKDGSCPGPQEGLPNGAYCGTVKTGVYGCKPNSDEKHEHEHAPEDKPEDKPESNPALCSGEGESPMSVEGVEGIFCVKGQACVADIKDGACPGPQEGLPNGAVCGKVKTGVYGCKPAEAGDDDDDDDDDDDSDDDSDDGKCGEGESPMSVEGVEGIFCVKGQACVADIKDGACPGPQEGLPNGAVCGKVKTGVYGCKPAGAEEKPVGDHDHDDHDDHEDHDDSEESEESDDGKCGEGESPMSVEGVEGIFCVKGQACVADIKDGACPGPQDGLPNGAVCGKVKTGVYGCKPKEADDDDDDDDSDDKCGEGESPMSVEGVEGIFCVKGQACVADIKDGACPGPQEGLPNGAECGVVKTGVYGCKPKAAKHRKSTTKKGHSIKVVKAHAKKVTHKKH